MGCRCRYFPQSSITTSYHYISDLCIVHAVLTAVVVQAPNEVEEVTGSITVCVSISGATLNRTVNVAVMTEDGTAIGM